MCAFARNFGDRAELELRLAAGARAVPPKGRMSSGSVTSYFVPSPWDAEGRRKPPRESPLGLSRPVDLLRDKTRVAWTTWIPPWLGDIRRRLEIVEDPDGYYRLHLGALQKELGAVALAEAGLAKVNARLGKLEGAVTESKAALVAATAAALDKKGTLEGAKVALKSLQDAKAEAAAIAAASAALGKAQVESDAATAKEAAATAALAVATKDLADAAPEKAPAVAAVNDARTALFTARSEATTKGRVEVRLQVRAPREALLDDGRRVPLVVVARVVGLTDCATGGRKCPAFDAEPTPLRDLRGKGYFGGTIELDGVDLSGAFSLPDASVASKDEFLKLGATVEVKLWRPDIGRPSDGNHVPGAFVDSATRRIVLRPWHRPIPDQFMTDEAKAAVAVPAK